MASSIPVATTEKTIPDSRYRCFLLLVGETLCLDPAVQRGINPLLLSHHITYDGPLLPDLLVLDFVGLDKTDPRFLAIGVLKRPNHDGIEPWREVEDHG